VSHKIEEVPQDQRPDKLVLEDLVMVMNVPLEVVEVDKEEVPVDLVEVIETKEIKTRKPGLLLPNWED